MILSDIKKELDNEKETGDTAKYDKAGWNLKNKKTILKEWESDYWKVISGE